MSQEVIHVYLMPGMAASPLIFEHIRLPENQFEIHLLEWFLPVKNESLSNYAQRMAQHIKHENIVLLGVSFGGVLVQEMCQYLKVRKLIIVSSVKSPSELPKRMHFAKSTKAYKLVPTSLASRVDVLAKYAYGHKIKKRLNLYKMYLSVSDKTYLDWALEQMMEWNPEGCISDIIHIHGDKDPIFPIRNISDCIIVKNGTHAMIIYKYKWFNENLPRLILED
ncbi:alpha/beta hydrolase [Hyunsoonleella rubra]|uniref:Alpha/beta hydrolase n=1 Tax=Hyunsoonleella rubra TaxID=1737062 RepID=A0ABW5TDQ5_9FLAO